MLNHRERCSITSKEELLKYLDKIFQHLNIAEYKIVSLSNVYTAAKILGIPSSCVDDALRYAIEENLLELIIEIRCPRCDSEISQFNNINEIPDTMICEYCGYKWRKNIDLEHSLVLLITATDKGARFFRAYRKDLISQLILAIQERLIKRKTRSMF